MNRKRKPRIVPIFNENNHMILLNGGIPSPPSPFLKFLQNKQGKKDVA
jgi:hypothetical protein